MADAGGVAAVKPYLIGMLVVAALAVAAAVAFGAILVTLTVAPPADGVALWTLAAAVAAALLLLCLGLVTGFVLGLLAAEREYGGP